MPPGLGSNSTISATNPFLTFSAPQRDDLSLDNQLPPENPQRSFSPKALSPQLCPSGRYSATVPTLNHSSSMMPVATSRLDPFVYQGDTEWLESSSSLRFSSDTDLTHSALVSEIDFTPFLTPGPGSTLSHVSNVPHLPKSPGGSEILPQSFLNDANPAQSFNHTTCSPPGSIKPGLSKPAFSPMHDLCLSPYITPAISDPTLGYSSDDIPDYNEEYLTDDSGSDPRFEPSLASAHNLPDLYATPGPEYCLPRRIYFDSPTEDPSNHDSLQLRSGIEYDALDFHWEPYFRKGSDQGEEDAPTVASLPQIYDLSDGADTEHKLWTKLPTRFPTPECLPSPSPFRFSVHHLENINTATTFAAVNPPQPRTPDVQPVAPVFAPAPGIFISPLRGSDKIHSSPVSCISR